jgi:hypothetical protein
MRPSVSVIRQLAEEWRDVSEENENTWDKMLDDDLLAKVERPSSTSTLFPADFRWHNIFLDDNFLSLAIPGQALTALKIPESWGRQWIFLISSIECSYALNRLLCRWFELKKDELAIIHLQPILPEFNGYVWGVPPNISGLRAEVFWYHRNLGMSARFGLYPYRIRPPYAIAACPLVDVLFVECEADVNIETVNITLTLCFPNLGHLIVNAAAAIQLDEGSAEIAALWAMPLSDETLLETAEDVADYLRNLLAWVDAPERTPCPGTQLTGVGSVLMQQAPPPGCRCYLWGFSMNPMES